MSRQLLTPRSIVRELGKREGGIYHGRLAEDYDGIGQYVLVALAGSSVAAAYKTRVAAGDFGGGQSIPRGTPVSVVSHRGNLEVFLGNRPSAGNSCPAGQYPRIFDYAGAGFGHQTLTGNGPHVMVAQMNQTIISPELAQIGQVHFGFYVGGDVIPPATFVLSCLFRNGVEVSHNMFSQEIAGDIVVGFGISMPAGQFPIGASESWELWMHADGSSVDVFTDPIGFAMQMLVITCG